MAGPATPLSRTEGSGGHTGSMEYVGRVPAPPLDRFMGVWTRRFLFEYPLHVRLVGVHFKPWGTSPFVDMPAAELRNRWVPVDTVWQRSVDRIRNRVGDVASAAETFRVLEEELRSRLAEAPARGLDLVEHTAGCLETSYGTIPVGALADAAGVSGNHLANPFKAHVGVTPNRVARIYRFGRLIARWRQERRVRRPVRISLTRISGCSKAAKCPPLSASP